MLRLHSGFYLKQVSIRYSSKDLRLIFARYQKATWFFKAGEVGIDKDRNYKKLPRHPLAFVCNVPRCLQIIITMSHNIQCYYRVLYSVLTWEVGRYCLSYKFFFCCNKSLYLMIVIFYSNMGGHLFKRSKCFYKWNENNIFVESNNLS